MEEILDMKKKSQFRRDLLPLVKDGGIDADGNLSEKVLFSRPLTKAHKVTPDLRLLLELALAYGEKDKQKRSDQSWKELFKWARQYSYHYSKIEVIYEIGGRLGERGEVRRATELATALLSAGWSWWSIEEMLKLVQKSGEKTPIGEKSLRKLWKEVDSEKSPSARTSGMLVLARALAKSADFSGKKKLKEELYQSACDLYKILGDISWEKLEKSKGRTFGGYDKTALGWLYEDGKIWNMIRRDLVEVTLLTGRSDLFEKVEDELDDRDESYLAERAVESLASEDKLDPQSKVFERWKDRLVAGKPRRRVQGLALLAASLSQQGCEDEAQPLWDQCLELAEKVELSEFYPSAYLAVENRAHQVGRKKLARTLRERMAEELEDVRFAFLRFHMGSGWVKNMVEQGRAARGKQLLNLLVESALSIEKTADRFSCLQRLGHLLYRWPKKIPPSVIEAMEGETDNWEDEHQQASMLAVIARLYFHNDETEKARKYLKDLWPYVEVLESKEQALVLEDIYPLFVPLEEVDMWFDFLEEVGPNKYLVEVFLRWQRSLLEGEKELLYTLRRSLLIYPYHLPTTYHGVYAFQVLSIRHNHHKGAAAIEKARKALEDELEEKVSS